MAQVPVELAGAARALFGDRLPMAIEYARLLVSDGVVRGLIGPREAPRIWDRHLLNCAAMTELIPARSAVFDVGSGAGLPGVALAIARPDLSVGLIEPLARRVTFLTEVVELLGLGATVTVFRARAEEVNADVGTADIVAARAVAPLDRLARWCLPLVEPGGRLLAMKGASAGAEVAEHRAAIARLGGGTPQVLHCAVGLLDPPTTVVEVVRERVVGRSAGKRRTAARTRSKVTPVGRWRGRTRRG